MWTKKIKLLRSHYLLSWYINTEKEKKAVTFHLQVGIVFVSSNGRKCDLYDGLGFVNLMFMKNMSSSTS